MTRDMMMMIMCLQREAEALRHVTTVGVVSTVETKIIAVGIGDLVEDIELQNMASPPYDENVFHVRDFDSLSNIADKLLNDTCTGKHSTLYHIGVGLIVKLHLCDLL